MTLYTVVKVGFGRRGNPQNLCRCNSEKLLTVGQHIEYRGSNTFWDKSVTVSPSITILIYLIF